MKSRSSPLADLYGRPGFLLHRAHQVVAAIFEEECGAYGVTQTQYGLLMAIASVADIDVIDASRLTGFDRTTAHVAISNLERRGWIKRSSDRRDKRRHLLTVTPAGRELMRVTKPALDRVKQRFFSKLRPVEARALLKILSHIVGKPNASPSSRSTGRKTSQHRVKPPDLSTGARGLPPRPKLAPGISTSLSKNRT